MQTPDATVEAFAAALRQNRPEAAYGLMSRAYRLRVSLEEFRRHLRDNPAEARETVTALSRREGHAVQEAIVRYADGEEVELSREGGSWHINSNLVDFYDQGSPRAALRSFVRAMQRGRYDVVLRMVPNADREGMTVEAMEQAWSGEGREEVERLLATLRANLDAPIEQVGDRATMPYGDHTALLLREDGVWKIEDPD